MGKEYAWRLAHEKLILEIDDIPWEIRDGAEHTLKAMNKAFAVYHRAYQMGVQSKGNAMSDSIHDSFTDGSGQTVADDLEEAFEYLSNRQHLRYSKTEYWWNDMHRQRYRGHFYNGPVQVPKSIYEFLTSVENKMTKLAKIYNDWGEQSWLAEEQIQNQDWKKLGRNISSVSKAAEKASHLIWLAPPSIKNRFGQTTSFVNVTSSLHGAATAYAHGNLSEHVQMELAVTVLEKLPILGQFYGAALRSIPGLVSNVSARIKCKVDVIDSLVLAVEDRCREDNPWFNGR